MCVSFVVSNEICYIWSLVQLLTFIKDSTAHILIGMFDLFKSILERHFSDRVLRQIFCTNAKKYIYQGKEVALFIIILRNNN